MSAMRVLITGGAGTLGAALAERLLADGHAVAVIDNFATGARENLPDHPRLSLTEGSIAEAALVQRCFADFAPTHVINAAASYKDPDDFEEDLHTNALGSAHLARAARAAKASRIVNLQTALCFGRPETVPVPKDHPCRPFTSYGISKTAGEQLLLASGLNVVSLRIANVTGPRLAIGPIPTFYKRLKAGQGVFCTAAVRDFLDQEDFLALALRTLDASGPRGVFNASTGVGHSVRAIYDAVVAHLGHDGPAPPERPVGDDDVPAMVLDPSDTIAAFGWRPKHDFASTMRRMLAWYDAHGVTAIFSHLRAPEPAR
jgi:UDP-glucose 4-epimerase